MSLQNLHALVRTSFWINLIVVALRHRVDPAASLKKAVREVGIGVVRGLPRGIYFPIDRIVPIIPVMPVQTAQIS
jgi:hypothetical protein